MPQIPGSPAYGLAAADPPRDRGGPWTAFWVAPLGTFLAYLDASASPSSRSRRQHVPSRTLRVR